MTDDPIDQLISVTHHNNELLCSHDNNGVIIICMHIHTRDSR
jgi:hypothetical protein